MTDMCICNIIVPNRMVDTWGDDSMGAGAAAAVVHAEV